MTGLYRCGTTGRTLSTLHSSCRQVVLGRENKRISLLENNSSITVNFLKKNEITIPRLPPIATEPTYELMNCENKFLNVVLIP